MNSSVYNKKLIDLYHDNNTYEQMSPQTIFKSKNDFKKSNMKLVPKEDKSWSSLIDYHPILKIYGLPNTKKPDISPRPIISGIGSTPPITSQNF